MSNIEAKIQPNINVHGFFLSFHTAVVQMIFNNVEKVLRHDFNQYNRYISMLFVKEIKKRVLDA